MGGTPALRQGKDPIILPEDASFKICIKFLSGSYTNPTTGEVVERAGRDWAHDSGKKSTCAVSSSLAPLLRNTSPGSPPPLTAPTQAQPRRLLCISSQMLDLLPSCAYSCPPKLTLPQSGRSGQEWQLGVLASAALSRGT